MKKLVLSLALVSCFATAAHDTLLPQPDAMTLAGWDSKEMSKEFNELRKEAKGMTVGSFCSMGGIRALVRQHATMDESEDYKRAEDDAWSEYNWGLTRVMARDGHKKLCDDIYFYSYKMAGPELYPDEYDAE